MVEHRHRATTSRYYTREQLEEVLEINYLKFLVRAVANPRLFRRLWRQATRRLRASVRPAPLKTAARMALEGGPAGVPEYPEELILALTSGAVAVFPGGPSGVAHAPWSSGGTWQLLCQAIFRTRSWWPLPSGWRSPRQRSWRLSSRWFWCWRMPLRPPSARIAPNRPQVAAGGGSPRGPANGAVRRRLRTGPRDPGAHWRHHRPGVSRFHVTKKPSHAPLHEKLL